MSQLVVVQVGQCGNQVGMALFDAVAAEAAAAPAGFQRAALRRFFRGDGGGPPPPLPPPAASKSRRRRMVAPPVEVPPVEAEPAVEEPVEAAEEEDDPLAGELAAIQSKLDAALLRAARARRVGSAARGRGRGRGRRGRGRRKPVEKEGGAAPAPAPTPAPAAARVPPKPAPKPAAPSRRAAPKPTPPKPPSPEESEEEAGAGEEDAAPRPPLVARAVLVDMEPKVINRCLEHRHPWVYDASQVYFQQSGSGNNWGHGFGHFGPRCEEAVVRHVRREVAQADAFGGFLLLQSAAGGTGSGFGTRVAEALRAAFPDALLINCVVWPYDSGEVIVQHYNSLLTMSHICRVSDGVLVIENDVVGRVCRELLRIPAPSFHDLNGVIARYLAMLFLPAAASDRGGEPLSLASLVTHLCSHPGFRIMTVRMLPVMPPSSVKFSVHSWAGILKHLKQMQVADAKLEEGINWRLQEGSPGANKAVSTAVILRGEDAGHADASGFEAPTLYAGWASPPCAVFRSRSHFGGYDKAGAVISCCQSIVPLLERSLGRAFQMFEAGAFLHQYRQFGVTEEAFLAAFAYMEQIVYNYKSL